MRSVIAPLTIVVLFLAACDGGSEESAKSTSSPVASASSSTGATGDRVLISGTAVCDFTGGMTEKKSGPVTTYEGPMACKDEASDPRVSGLDEFELTETVFMGRGNDIAWFRCENATLTTEGGTWRGECYGSEFTNPDDGALYTSGHATFVGEGAYEGLVYHQLYTQYPAADHYFIAGWIEPSAP
jgi:hypothetical protein